MKKTFKKITSLLMATALCMGLATTSFAAENDFTMMVIRGKDGTENCVEWVNYDGRFVDGDLFKEFKNVMPGDVKQQTVYIQNGWTEWEYIILSMRAVLHDEEGNPISTKVLNELEADERNEMESELAYMHDFLHQLTLTVKNGDTTIYKGHPDELLQGFEQDAHSFGRINQGDTVKLDVTLEVPAEMGNAYANRVGEVDWVFTYSGQNDPGPEPEPEPEPEPGPGPGPGPDPTPDPEPLPDPDVPLSPVEPPVEIPEEPVPQAPKTGDETSVLPYVLLFAVGLVGMIVTTVGKRSKQK